MSVISSLPLSLAMPIVTYRLACIRSLKSKFLTQSRLHLFFIFTHNLFAVATLIVLIRIPSCEFIAGCTLSCTLPNEVWQCTNGVHYTYTIFFINKNLLDVLLVFFDNTQASDFRNKPIRPIEANLESFFASTERLTQTGSPVRLTLFYTRYIRPILFFDIFRNYIIKHC
jgi:hypothetical protein